MRIYFSMYPQRNRTLYIELQSERLHYIAHAGKKGISLKMTTMIYDYYDPQKVARTTFTMLTKQVVRVE